MNNQEWAKYIKMQRKRQGLTLRCLADRAGVDPSYVTLIERDGYIPRRDKVLALAKALECDVDRTLLEAGYAPATITIGSILGKNSIETSEDVLIPELGKCLRELISLTSLQQHRVADFLSSFIYTLKFKERERRQQFRVMEDRRDEDER